MCSIVNCDICIHVDALDSMNVSMNSLRFVLQIVSKRKLISAFTQPSLNQIGFYFVLCIFHFYPHPKYP